MSVASPGPSVPMQTSASKQLVKSKPAMGISAGAEDSMYHLKYKTLKRKVKELEADNDRLLFKSLQAKRTVQRLKLERAILYERLVAVPASPEISKDVPLPFVPETPLTNPAHPPPHLRPSRQASPSNGSFPTGSRYHDTGRGRTMPNIGEPDDHDPTPVHGASLSDGRSGRYSETLPPIAYRSNGGPGASRHPAPLPVVQPLQATSHPSSYPPRNGNHSLATSPKVLGPSSSSQDRHISSGHSRNHPTQPIYQLPRDMHSERLPPMEQSFGDPAREQSGERESGRQRRYETHEYDRPLRDRGTEKSLEIDSRGRSRQYDPSLHERGPPPDTPAERGVDKESEMEGPRRHEPHEHGGIPPPERYRTHHSLPISHDSHSRQVSGRLHNHQRVGPGTYLNRPTDERHEQEMEVEREREWEYAHSQAGRPRQPLPPPSHYHQSEREPSRERERGMYYDHPPPHQVAAGPSRSTRSQWAGGDTPGGSGSTTGPNLPPVDFPPRPSSPGVHHESDRRAPPRQYALRPIDPDDPDYPMEEPPRNSYRDYSHPKLGYQYPDVEHPQPSRKRSKRDLSPNTVPVQFVDDGPRGVPVTVFEGSEGARPDFKRARRHSLLDRDHEEREHDQREN